MAYPPYHPSFCRNIFALPGLVLSLPPGWSVKVFQIVRVGEVVVVKEVGPRNAGSRDEQVSAEQRCECAEARDNQRRAIVFKKCAEGALRRPKYKSSARATSHCGPARADRGCAATPAFGNTQALRHQNSSSFTVANVKCKRYCAVVHCIRDALLGLKASIYGVSNAREPQFSKTLLANPQDAFPRRGKGHQSEQC